MTIANIFHIIDSNYNYDRARRADTRVFLALRTAIPCSLAQILSGTTTFRQGARALIKHLHDSSPTI